SLSRISNRFITRKCIFRQRILRCFSRRLRRSAARLSNKQCLTAEFLPRQQRLQRNLSSARLRPAPQQHACKSVLNQCRQLPHPLPPSLPLRALTPPSLLKSPPLTLPPICSPAPPPNSRPNRKSSAFHWLKC